MKKSVTLLFAVLLAFALPAGCGKSEFEYSSERCYFVIDNSVHLDAVLQGALNSASPGTFCRISAGTDKGVLTFSFDDNYGNHSSKHANSEDLRRSCVLGIYNKTGIIVGYGNLGTPAPLYAYDSQCPNCYYSTNTPSYCLRLTSAGHAVCSRCRREYDMNNGGLVAKGDPGSHLLRYRRVSCTGPQGVLVVQNP